MTNNFVLLLLYALASANAAAAGFDCTKANAPIEKVICADPELSLADFVLTERYQHLLARCGERPDAQKAWLADARAESVPGEAGVTRLRARYLARNEELLRALDTCSLKRPIAPLRIATFGQANDGVKLPWVEAPSPEVSRRINDEVFARFANMTAAPERLRDAPAVLDTDDQRRGIPAQFSVARNDGRLLVLEFEAADCGNYCENLFRQMAFDARTGKPLENETLFTEEGLKTLTNRFNSALAARGRALVAQAKRRKIAEDDEISMYKSCIRNWTGELSSMPVPELVGRSEWQLHGGHCSPDAARHWNLLDDISVPLTRALLAAHLSPYGKSLLLGQGDVRDPAPPPPKCLRSGPLPEASHPVMRGAAQGVDHNLVVLADGSLLAWGANNDGQLGRGNQRTDIQPQVAHVVPGTYLSVAAGHGWSAAIDSEGRLWTWGSNYMASLGDGGTKLRTQPAAVGEGFVQLRAEGRWGLALKRDGSLWTWGGRVATHDPANETYITTPWALGRGFAHIELGPRGELQALARDGELWTWRGFSSEESMPDDEPRKLGNGGYTRLAGHHMQAAYKADGTLWAWGETLAAMVDVGGDTKRPPQAVGRGFAHAVYAPDGVVAALKDDGSLWLTTSRGRVTQLEPVGCGYQRLALVGSTWERQPKHLRVVALRDDGHLVAWRYTRKGGEPGEPTPAAPWNLGAGWQQLTMTDGQWGNRGTELLLADDDGNLWQRRAESEKNKPTAKDWLQRVER